MKLLLIIMLSVAPLMAQIEPGEKYEIDLGTSLNDDGSYWVR